jgi:flavodoxin
MSSEAQVAVERRRAGGGQAGRALVVYYSRTGVTRTVAQAIARRLDADSEELADTRKRSGPWGFLVAIKDAMRKKVFPIGPVRKNPAEYDLVTVGTPVWAGTMSSAVRAYLAEHGGQIAKSAFFCTQGGRSPGRTFQDMQALCGKAPVATLSLQAKVVKAGEFAPQADAFAEGLRRPAGP